MLKFICTFFLLVVASQARSLQKRDSVEDKGSHLLVCTQEPIELGIVLDGSSSIQQSDFDTGIKFVQDFLQQFDIGDGRNDVRVSIITYGLGVYKEDAFNLDTYHNKPDVIAAVGRIHHHFGQRTDTGAAIEYMTVNQMAKKVVRSYAERISIIITDGNSQDEKFTKRAAKAARDAGIITFAVGVGKVKKSELLNIAGDITRVTQVENYNDLDSIKEVLARRTCIRKEKPTTTPPPKTETCGEANPADIFFVFSPSAMGLEKTAWTTSFIANTVSTEDMDVGFQYGAMTGTCPDDEGFDLDEYNSVNAIRSRLSYYDRSRMPQLIKRLSSDGFTAERGARPGARKIAVLFASEGKKGGKGGDMTQEVEKLIREGVQVFIADPDGNGVSIDGATSLYGHSSRQQSEDFIGRLCPENF